MRFEGERNNRIGSAFNRSNGTNRLFSAAECDTVIHWLEERAGWDRTAPQSGTPELGNGLWQCNVIKLDPSLRNRAIDWLPSKLSDIVAALNRKIWHFDIDELSELYLLRYDEGDQVTLHIDLNDARCRRKIAVLTQLSPADAYQGGTLEYGFAPATLAAREQGSVLAFPAWVPHRVTPITSGRRYALSCFALGPSFR